MSKPIIAALSLLLIAGCTQGPLQIPGLSPTGGAPAGGGPLDQSAPLQGAPIINAISTSPSNLVKGQPVTFDVKATDPNGKPLEYRWGSSKGVLSATTGQLISWTPPDEAGVFAVQVVVVNSDGKASSGTINLIVEGETIKKDEAVLAPPGQTLPMLTDRVVATVGGDIALVDYQHPGEPPIYLTKNDILETQPDLSPDRSRVAYVRDGKLCVIPIGGRPLILDSAVDCVKPRWKPDGTLVLYGKDRKGGDAVDSYYNVYTVAPIAGAVPGLQVGYASKQWDWTGDSQVAHIRVLGYSTFGLFVGDKRFFGTGYLNDVWAFAPGEGQEFAAYTSINGFMLNTTRVGGISPKGSSPFAYRGGFVYTLMDDAITAFDEVSGEKRILASGVAKDSKAALSPDSKAVVYVSKNRDPRVGTDAVQLFSVSTQDGNPTQITFDPTGVKDPSF